MDFKLNYVIKKTSIYKVIDENILLIVPSKTYETDRFSFSSSSEVYNSCNKFGGFIVFYKKCNLNNLQWLIDLFREEKFQIGWANNNKISEGIIIEEINNTLQASFFKKLNIFFDLSTDKSKPKFSNNNFSLCLSNIFAFIDDDAFKLAKFEILLNKSKQNICMITGSDTLGEEIFGNQIRISYKTESFRSNLFETQSSLICYKDILGKESYVEREDNGESETKFLQSNLKNLSVVNKSLKYRFVLTTSSDGFNRNRLFPEGNIKIINTDSNELLLNSGTDTIEIFKGDEIEFETITEEISGSPYASTYIKIIPKSDATHSKERIYRSGSQNKTLYDTNKNAFLQKLGDAANKSIRILPDLNIKNFNVEEKELSKERFEKLINKTDKTSQLKSKSFKNDPEQAILTNGSKITFKNGKIDKYTFTNSLYNKSAVFELDFSDSEIGDKWYKLALALNKGRVLLVFPTNFNFHQSKDASTGVFNIEEWRFDIYPTEDSKKSNTESPLITFNYSNYSFEDTFKKENTGFWTNNLLFNGSDNDYTPKAWQERGESFFKSIISEDDLPFEHKEIFTNKSWKGVTVFDIPLQPTSFPKLIRSFIPEENTLFAKYLAFGSAAQGEDQKCFAYISYDNKNGKFKKGNDFKHRLTYLKTIISGSEIVSMDCTIEFQFDQILNDEVKNKEDGEPTTIKIKGTYDKKNKKYSFEVEGDNLNRTILFRDSFIKSLTINGAGLGFSNSEITGDKKEKINKSEANVYVKFNGKIEFNLEKIDKIKKGIPGFEDFNIFPQYFDFLDLAFNVGSFMPMLDLLKFDLAFAKAPNNEKTGILDSFPLKYNSFYFETAADLNLIQINGEDPLFKKSIGLLFDLELGTLGALSSLDNLKSQFFIGWHKDKNTDKESIDIGFRINGFSTSVDFSIQDVIKIKIDKIELKHEKLDGKPILSLQLLDCEFGLLGTTISPLNGVIFFEPNANEIGWLMIYEKASSEDSEAATVKGNWFEIKKLAIGQKTGLSSQTNQRNKLPGTIDAVLKEIETSIKVAPLDLYRPKINTLVALELEFKSLFKLSLVFMDPELYALRIEIAKFIDVEVLYQKLKDNLGVWHGRLALSDDFRNLDFGAVAITLPNLKIDWFTNGGFKLDLGFPVLKKYTWDYSDSSVAQLGPFIGKGGTFISKLKNIIILCEDKVALQYGIALRVGIGREFNKGPIRAGAHITVYGIFIGTGCFAKKDGLLPKSFSIQGRAGIILEAYGVADFRIVKATVRVWLEVYAMMAIEVVDGKLLPIPIEVGGRVYVTAKIKIKIGFIKITKKFRFGTKIKYEFEIGGGSEEKSLNTLLLKTKKQFHIIEPVILKLAYLPRFTVHSLNPNSPPRVRLYHTVGLITPNIENPYIYINQQELLNLREDEDVLITIIKQFIKIDNLAKPSLEIDEYEVDGLELFDFVNLNLFEYELLAPSKEEWKDLSLLPFPILPGLGIDTGDGFNTIKEKESSQDYINEVDEQFNDYLIQFNQRKEKIILKDKEKSEENPFAIELLNDFYRFIYAQAFDLCKDHRITFEDLIGDDHISDLTDDDTPTMLQLRYRLNGLIQYFYNSGLRIKNPKDLGEITSKSSTIPLNETFNYAVFDYKTNTQELTKFNLRYNNNVPIEGLSYFVTDIDSNFNLGSNRVKLQELAKSYKKLLRTRLNKITNDDRYITKNSELEFEKYEESIYTYPEHLSNKHLNSFKIYTVDLKKSKKIVSTDSQLRNEVSNPNEYKNVSIINFNVKTSNFGDNLNKILFELENTSSKDSSILRSLASKPVVLEATNLIGIKLYFDTETENTIFVPLGKNKEDESLATIYRNNLSKVTNPTIDSLKASLEKDNFKRIHVAELSVKEKLNFFNILLDASLTNSGGYFLNFKSELVFKEVTEALKNSKAKNIISIDFVIAYEANKDSKVKLDCQNGIIVEKTVKPSEENTQSLILSDIIILSDDKEQLLLDHIPVSKPNILDIRLEDIVTESDDPIDLILSDFQFLEVGLEGLTGSENLRGKSSDRKFQLSNDQVISILPEENELDENKFLWKSSIPLQKASLKATTLPKRNRYDLIGKEITLTCNWRNSLGDRFFETPIDIDIQAKKYTDELLGINEWPDFQYKLVWNETRNLTFKYILKPNVFRKKTSSDSEYRNEIFKYYNGKGSILNGALEKLFLIYDQLEDVLARDPNSLKFLFLANEKQIIVDPNNIGKQIKTSLYEYLRSVQGFLKMPDSADIPSSSGGLIVFNSNQLNHYFTGLIDKKRFTTFSFSFKISRDSSLVPKTLNNSTIKNAEVITEIPWPGFYYKNNDLEKKEKIWLSKIGDFHLGQGFDPISKTHKYWIISEIMFKFIGQNSTNQEQEGKSKVDYLIKPLATHKISGQYKPNTGNESIFSFGNVDVNIAFKNILSTYQEYTKPIYFKDNQTNLELLKRLLEFKEKITNHLSKHYLFRHYTDGKDEIVQELPKEDVLIEAFNDYLLNDLNNFYRTQGVTKNYIKDQKTDYNLYISNEEKHRDFLTIDTSKKINDNYFFAFISENKTDNSSILVEDEIARVFHCTHIEHNILSSDSKITESNWIKLLEPIQVKSTHRYTKLTRLLPPNPLLRTSKFEHDRIPVSTTTGKADLFDNLIKWNYIAQFQINFDENNGGLVKGDLLTIVATDYTNVNSTRKEKFKYQGEVLDLNAIVYLDTFINSRKSKKDIIKKLAEIKILLPITENKSSLNNDDLYSEIFTFKYNGNKSFEFMDSNKTIYKSAIEVIQTGQTYTCYFKINNISLNDDLCGINTSIQVLRNKNYGEHFRMETPKNYFPSITSPLLNYWSLKNGGRHSLPVLREVDSTFCEKLIEYLNLNNNRIKFNLEKRKHTLNGVKHILSPFPELIDDLKIVKASNIFEKNYYYNLEVFLKVEKEGINEYRELLKLDFKIK